MSLMSETGLWFDQINQSFGKLDDFWIAIECAMVQ